MRKGIRSGIVITLMLLGTVCANRALAQRTVDQQMNSWYMYFGTHRISERWDVHTQYQWRRSGLINKWQQSLMQAGLNYRIQKNFTASVGYGWLENFPNGKQPVGHEGTEHRIWEQLTMKQHFGRVGISHRYRLEQRYIQKWKSNEGGWNMTGWNYVNRGRYQLGITVPINHATMADRTLFATGYEEIFIGFGKNVKGNVFDQNRAFIGLGYKQNAALSFKLGYMNQWLMKGDGDHAESNHTLQVAVIYNLDLRKKHSDAEGVK